MYICQGDLYRHDGFYISFVLIHYFIANIQTFSLKMIKNADMKGADHTRSYTLLQIGYTVLSLFQNLSKVLVSIAYNINHNKELRDLFIDLVEKVMELFMAYRVNSLFCNSVKTLPGGSHYRNLRTNGLPIRPKTGNLSTALHSFLLWTYPQLLSCDKMIRQGWGSCRPR